MRLYFQYIKMQLRSSMQYKLSFFMSVVGQAFNTLFGFLGIVFLFQRFGEVKGYTLGEVAMCYAVINMAFALTECYARGFDMFSQLIVSGDFDRLLVRPRSLILQVFGTRFELSRIGRLIEALVMLCLAAAWLDTAWNLPRMLTVISMVLGGAGIFTGIFFLGAALCFITVQGLEVVNIFTDGGREVASYPITIFGKWAARFFTFIIPFGCVNYLPLLYIAGRTQNWMSMFLPLIGILYALPCAFVWLRGVRRYISTGS